MLEKSGILGYAGGSEEPMPQPQQIAQVKAALAEVEQAFASDPLVQEYLHAVAAGGVPSKPLANHHANQQYLVDLSQSEADQFIQAKSRVSFEDTLGSLAQHLKTMATRRPPKGLTRKPASAKPASQRPSSRPASAPKSPGRPASRKSTKPASKPRSAPKPESRPKSAPKPASRPRSAPKPASRKSAKPGQREVRRGTAGPQVQAKDLVVGDVVVLAGPPSTVTAIHIDSAKSRVTLKLQRVPVRKHGRGKTETVDWGTDVSTKAWIPVTPETAARPAKPTSKPTSIRLSKPSRPPAKPASRKSARKSPPKPASATPLPIATPRSAPPVAIMPFAAPFVPAAPASPVLRIDDPNALQVLTELEGPNWYRRQEKDKRRLTDSGSFWSNVAAYKALLDTKREMGAAADFMIITDILPDAGFIQGFEGELYAVLPDGQIALIADTAALHKRYAAARYMPVE